MSDKMQIELQQKLVDLFPTQFSELKYIECSDGWYNLIEKACSLIQSYIDNTNHIIFLWAQIKQYDGHLQMYCYGADEYIKGIIHMAESISETICEISGDRGQLCQNNSIVKTLSKTEALKNNYTYME